MATPMLLGRPTAGGQHHAAPRMARMQRPTALRPIAAGSCLPVLPCCKPRSLIRAAAADGSTVKHSVGQAASERLWAEFDSTSAAGLILDSLEPLLAGKADSAVPAATPGFKWGADMKTLGISVAIGVVLWFIPPPSGVTAQACLVSAQL